MYIYICASFLHTSILWFPALGFWGVSQLHRGKKQLIEPRLPDISFGSNISSLKGDKALPSYAIGWKAIVFE